jgi:predicted RNA methylase
MKISDEVLEVLANAKIENSKVFLSGQLDRKVYTKVNDVLMAAGGKWSKKERAHVFEDATDAIEQALLVGEITTHQDIDFFPTPFPIVHQMLEVAAIEKAHRVLEPSAGDGAIARHLNDISNHVTCIERDSKLAEICRGIRQEAFRKRGINSPNEPLCNKCDFMQVRPEPMFDRIIMNPPFSRRQDVQHILHAYNFLAPGGRLVSIAGSGVMFRADGPTKRLREMAFRSGTITPLPPGSFKPSGTMVNTVMVVINNVACP